MTRSVTWRGLIWATTLPACWLILFYAFVGYVRFSLGRWPEFGQQLEGGSYAVLDQVSRFGAQALVSSLFIVPVLLIACLFFRRWRHVSVYAATYAIAVGVAIGAVFLAPHPFMNWYLD